MNDNLDIFYCYSYRLLCFLKSMGFEYIKKGRNLRSGSVYYTFRKSEKLDDAIILWNAVKFKLKEKTE